MADTEAERCWRAISEHRTPRIAQLFADEPDRLSRLTLEVAAIHFDFAKTHLGGVLLDQFSALAEAVDLAGKRDALFAGAVVNPSEGRAAEHPAERGQGAPEAVALAAARRERMRALTDAIEAGAFGQVSGLLHIGIGGSALGPKLVIDALGRTGVRYRVATLSNIDGQAFDEAVAELDPETTLVAIASKTMTTAETLRNAASALDWLAAGGVGDPYGRLVALTAAPEKAVEFGIDETRILQLPESVGGRYSLWSAVGFPAALALGWSAFEELLEGAAEMDRHFRLAPASANAPMLAAFADLYYCQARGCQSRALFPYDERLRLLVPYIQQLEMESNGKSVRSDGSPLGRPSAAVVWGGTGTDAQHAVFQLLHQGTVIAPAEFVAVAAGADDQDPEHHRQLLLNAFAQGAALMTGRESDDLARSYAGDRPSLTLLLDRLDPRTLGALLAFYEHRTFAIAMLLGINPFDQFGVELDKEIARAIDRPEQRRGFDSSTRALIERAGV